MKTAGQRARGPLLALAATALAVLAMAIAAPASALARAVTGGGTFAEAPLIGAGTFTDTLLPRETLFYAVRLSRGQRLTVRGTVDVGVGNRTRGIPVAGGGFSLDLYTPCTRSCRATACPTPGRRTSSPTASASSDRGCWLSPRRTRARSTASPSGPGPASTTSRRSSRAAARRSWSTR